MIFVEYTHLFFRLNCSMFSHDKGSDEELDDKFPIENERYMYFLFHVTVISQNNDVFLCVFQNILHI